MLSLIRTDPLLSQEQVIYRTLDFFSASSIVTNQSLIFSRADEFFDKNEGIDLLLAQIEIARPNSGCGMGWFNNETAQKRHQYVKQSHYISCWSLNPESVAMWSLYSPDFTSVRISTTISKLRKAVENLIEKYSFMKLSESDLGKRVVASVDGSISPVQYASLSEISKRVSRRAKARHRLSERYARKGKTMPNLLDVDKRYFEREKLRKFKELESVCNLKDLSFKHEEEVRASIRLGEEKCSTSMLEEQAFYDSGHKYHIVLKDTLRSWGLVTNSSLPKKEFVKCSETLIETVAIDPRCPSYKSDFIKKWFEDHGISVVKSDCFGYIPDSFEIYPEW